MRKALIIAVGFYAICIVLVSLLWRLPVLLAIACLVASIGILYKWHTRSDVTFYFVAFVLGPLGEVFAVYFGAWEYAQPQFLIMIWLPFLWGIAARGCPGCNKKKLCGTWLQPVPNLPMHSDAATERVISELGAFGKRIQL